MKTFKNLFKCCKNTESEHLEKWCSNIKEEEIAKIDEDKINFIYENATDYLKQIEAGMRTIRTRTTLLLAYQLIYLALMIAFSVHFALRTDNKLPEIFSLVIVIEYIFLIFYTTFNLLLKNKMGYPIKNEPKNLLIAEVIKFDLKTIKFCECENMQASADFNSFKQLESFKYFIKAVLLTFGLPAGTTILFLLWQIF